MKSKITPPQDPSIEVGIELKPDFEIPKSVQIGDDSYTVEVTYLFEGDYELNPQEKVIKISERLNAQIKAEVFMKAIFHLVVVAAMPANEFTDRILTNVMWVHQNIFKVSLRS